MRVDLIKALRDLHAETARLDGCSGQTSITTAFHVRQGWAASNWMALLEAAAAFLSDRAWLQKVGVLPQSAPWCPKHGHLGCGNPNAGCTCEVDQFLLESAEGIARISFGLIVRTFWLWSGGCYGLVNVLSEDNILSTAAIDRAQRLWPRLLAFEQHMASMAADAADMESCGMQAFEDGLLWPTGVVWREMHGLLAERRVDEAMMYIWRVHSSKYHEKGPQCLNNEEDHTMVAVTSGCSDLRLQALCGRGARSLGVDVICSILKMFTLLWERQAYTGCIWRVEAKPVISHHGRVDVQHLLEAAIPSALAREKVDRTIYMSSMPL